MNNNDVNFQENNENSFFIKKIDQSALSNSENDDCSGNDCDFGGCSGRCHNKTCGCGV